jgi:hypothetical protein
MAWTVRPAPRSVLGTKTQFKALEANPERHPCVTVVLTILAGWGFSSIAVGLWIGPMLRLATAEFRPPR